MGAVSSSIRATSQQLSPFPFSVFSLASISSLSLSSGFLFSRRHFLSFLHFTVPSLLSLFWTILVPRRLLRVLVSLPTWKETDCPIVSTCSENAALVLLS